MNLEDKVRYRNSLRFFKMSIPDSMLKNIGWENVNWDKVDMEIKRLTGEIQNAVL